ncbi:enoyl-CoA hydratase/isomerase family protein [Mucilaginibacter myungsuensis]|uniref:Enoyl-CoA hydratase/isomerase family protein n=1 Tax=Mucilaginibacter myungsuensis TaxID=649104 RepID=A0A929PVL2_9SPHI|nr:enoyl-CoA hydratase-related protein [Mucilaginibacter myungsuensis]MBE9661249.1 enoyl-CoA hydratase/isomerase family protein [Mucilaginibacter myungsuensis]MDN3597392.1 enoyl-CoA hydratase-related protein [Mucilaginibacter myungsuensis]
MSYQNILVDTKDRIQYITINRETKLNALNKETLDELHTALTQAFADDSVGGLIITGAGTKAFVAGADISGFPALDAAGGTALAQEGQTKVFDLIANGPKPIIAAVNGFALGGGLELAMACHIRIASDNAKMGLPELTLGLIPGYGGTQRLPQLVGKGKAMEMILTSDMLTADQALQHGLVNHVTEQSALIAKAEEILNKILSRSPFAVTAAITAINAAGSADGYQQEIALFGNCFGTADMKEGVDAFLNKRKPVFTGK